MNKFLSLLISIFLLNNCTKIELTNVGYDNIKFTSSNINNKNLVHNEINYYCLLFLCNRYDYKKFTQSNAFIYYTLKNNRDKGNTISDIEIKKEQTTFFPYIHTKLSLTGNMFYDTSFQP